MNIKRHLPSGILLFVVVFVQLLTALFGVNYYLTQLTMSAYYALVAIGLCMLMGYAGQLSLGQAGFFAIGGYTSAFFTTANLISYADMPLFMTLKKIGFLTRYTNSYGSEILHVSPWIAFIIAISITIVVAFLIGIPVLKLKGHYLAMATLGFGIIIYRIVLGTRWLGEADGISNIPGFGILPIITISGDFSSRVQNYYSAWILVILGMIFLTNLINSRVGRALRSLHGSEESASAMGVNISKYKLNIFVISAVFAAIGGIFLTHYNGGIGPSEAGVFKSVRYVAIVAVGGMANLWGTLIMSAVLNFLSLRGVFGSYDDAVFGIILILIMLFKPNGFLKVSVLKDIKDLILKIIRKKHVSS